MRVEIFRIDELSTENVAVYTVLLGENEHKLTEYLEFVARMSINDVNRFDLSELQHIIVNKIGVYGAIDKYFINERDAERIKQPTPDEYDPDLPDPKDYGLRLYCMRLSSEVLILFNGDRKRFKNPQECPNVEPYFTMANQIARAITEALHLKNIYLDGKDIVYKEQDDDEELYYVML